MTTKKEEETNTRLVIRFTKEQAQSCMSIFDTALKAQGLNVAQEVVTLGIIIQTAINGDS